jgi:hypothetical protein
MSASERDGDPSGSGSHIGDGHAPDLSEKESQELLTRIGRGVRAMVGDVLIDPLPPSFKRLLERLEGSEKSRGRA